jgi:hypothetical protein
MSSLVIELDDRRSAQLRRLAEERRRGPRDLAREAVEHFLEEGGGVPSPVVDAADPFAPLRAMIGLVPDGPSDASTHHDTRPGDDAP